MGSRGADADDLEYVLAAYERWGCRCVDRLEGDYSFALWDPSRQAVFAARDPLGIRPFYFARTPEGFAFASSAAQLDSVPGIDRSVRPEWLSLYLHGQSNSWDRTAFAGVGKLPPGHWLWADLRETTVTRFHQFVDDAPWEDVRDEGWLRAYSDVLNEAVRVRIDHDSPVGAETSGGLDSSSIVALIATLAPDVVPRMHTFGYCFEPLEPEFILETSRQWAVPFNHIMCALPGTQMDRERRGWQTVGYPVEHGNSIHHIPFYEMAAHHGVRTLHSGHGGDETVTNSAGLVAREMLSRGSVGPLLRDLPGSVVMRPARLAKRWRARRPGVTSHLTAPMLGGLRWSPLRDEVFEEFEVERLTWEAARYEAPHETVNDFILRNRLGPHVSTRTSECSIVAASYGVDYRWPLLDRRLVQQYLSTPAIWKYGEGFGRYLHRRAVAGTVPDKITWSPTKSMLPPGADSGAHTPAPAAADLAVPPRELHPDLHALLDQDKLARLTAERPTQDTLGPKRILRRVQTVNTWLHERSP